MGTRGLLGFCKNGVYKITYNHFDSYPSGLGNSVLNYINEYSIEDMNEHYDKIQMVKEKDIPTKQQIEKCKVYTDLNVSNQSLSDWYCLLRKAQGNLKAYSDVGFMIDNKDFLGDVSCQYAYIINLDDDTLEFYEGSKLAKEFPLDDCPENVDILEEIIG
jgi:hypothetical protein